MAACGGDEARGRLKETYARPGLACPWPGLVSVILRRLQALENVPSRPLCSGPVSNRDLSVGQTLPDMYPCRGESEHPGVSLGDGSLPLQEEGLGLLCGLVGGGAGVEWALSCSTPPVCDLKRVM